MTIKTEPDELDVMLAEVARTIRPDESVLKAVRRVWKRTKIDDLTFLALCETGYEIAHDAGQEPPNKVTAAVLAFATFARWLLDDVDPENRVLLSDPRTVRYLFSIGKNLTSASDEELTTLAQLHKVAGREAIRDGEALLRVIAKMRAHDYPDTTALLAAVDRGEIALDADETEALIHGSAQGWRIPSDS